MTWQPDPAARREILAAMRSRRRALTVLEIARLVGKTGSSVRQMIYALCADGIVAREHGHPGRTSYWKRTGKPLPKCITSTAATVREETSSRFDGCALAEALGTGRKPGAAVTGARTHLIHKGR